MPRTLYNGSADFLTPDGTHIVAACDMHFRRERWQGAVTLNRFARGLERGDVCRLTAAVFGELRVVILDRLGSHRYEFVALVKPDPFEAL